MWGALLQVEFEEVLPYKDFAVRVPSHMLYHLPTMLDNLMKEPGLVSTQHSALSTWHTWNSRHVWDAPLIHP